LLGFDLWRVPKVIDVVTTAAILIWLFTWGILEWRWRNMTVPAGRISVAVLTLLCFELPADIPSHR
jgi:hypothetical protein